MVLLTDSSAHGLDDASLENIFYQADDFLDEVGEIQTIIAQYTATSTTGKKAKNYIDEIGCFAPVGTHTMHPSQTLFWNACGAMYAYLFGHFTVLGIEYAGTSQLMAFPEIKGKVSTEPWLCRFSHRFRPSDTRTLSIKLRSVRFCS